MTAVFTSIDRIVVQEIFDCSALPSADMVQAIGFGRNPNESQAVIELGERYYGESLANTCRMLGHPMERLDMDREFIIADADYKIGSVAVAKGTIGGLVHRFTAVVDGQPFYTLEEIWYADRAICPVEVTAGDFWTIAVDGSPTCLRAKIELVGSLADNRRLRDADSDLPGYYGTGVPMLQAIPVVCGAAPGVVYPCVFTNYVPDLRMLDHSSPST